MNQEHELISDLRFVEEGIAKASLPKENADRVRRELEWVLGLREKPSVIILKDGLRRL